MTKVKTLSELKKICERLRKERKTVGLITGCFDILHLDHIELFRFAKKHVDVLIIGLDNDESIRISKGHNRPIFGFKERAQVLAEMKSIDYVFQIKEVIDFEAHNADLIYESTVEKLRPNILITNPLADKYWKKKKLRAKKFKLEFLPLKKRPSTSSSLLIRKLESEL